MTNTNGSPKLNRIYSCSSCAKQFRSFSGIKGHKKSKHDFPCATWGYGAVAKCFSPKSCLRRHEREKLERCESEKPFACTFVIASSEARPPSSAAPPLTRRNVRSRAPNAISILRRILGGISTPNTHTRCLLAQQLIVRYCFRLYSV